MTEFILCCLCSKPIPVRLDCDADVACVECPLGGDVYVSDCYYCYFLYRVVEAPITDDVLSEFKSEQRKRMSEMVKMINTMLTRLCRMARTINSVLEEVSNENE